MINNNGKMNLVGNGNAISFAGINDDPFIKEKKSAAVDIHNKAVDSYTQAVKSKYKSELQKAEEITQKMQTLEIMPIGVYVLVKPYAKNPYQKIEVTDSGIIIPEYIGAFKNPDSGEDDKEDNLSVQATVIAVSPTCKYVKEGDDIYYRRASGVPVPFFRQGLEVVAESQIQVVINEGLTERFKNM